MERLQSDRAQRLRYPRPETRALKPRRAHPRTGAPSGTRRAGPTLGGVGAAGAGGRGGSDLRRAFRRGRGAAEAVDHVADVRKLALEPLAVGLQPLDELLARGEAVPVEAETVPPAATPPSMMVSVHL